ncbi:hypothetical protein A2U01_0018089, partial [Trifolium medium]|nr:hypothetical protein [Trifolium medium]
NDEHEIALQQFVHLNINKSKVASMIYNVCKHNKEGLGYEYGKTYTKSSNIVCITKGNSQIYSFIPESEETKILNAPEVEIILLKGPEAVDLEDLSSLESEINDSEDQSVSEPETIESEALNTSEPKIIESKKLTMLESEVSRTKLLSTSDTEIVEIEDLDYYSESEINKTKNLNTSVLKVNKPRNLKHSEQKITQPKAANSFKTKVSNVKPQKQNRSQIYHQGKAMSYLRCGCK